MDAKQQSGRTCTWRISAVPISVGQPSTGKTADWTSSERKKHNGKAHHFARRDALVAYPRALIRSA